MELYEFEEAAYRLIEVLEGPVRYYKPGPCGELWRRGADLESYLQAQERVTADFLDRRTWARKEILNVARIGKFSSAPHDRGVRARHPGIRATC